MVPEVDVKYVFMLVVAYVSVVSLETTEVPDAGVAAFFMVGRMAVIGERRISATNMAVR